MTNKALPDSTATVNRIFAQLGVVILALVKEVVKEELKQPASDVVSDIEPGPVPPAKVRQLCKAGAFPATKKGRRWYFRRADLMAYLSPEQRPIASNDVAPAADPVDELAGKLGLRIGGRR